MCNIKIVKEEYLDCYEMIIMNLAKFWSREYYMLFSNAWGFRYQKKKANNKGLIGENIDLGNQFDNTLYLRKYNGINTEFFNKSFNFFLNNYLPLLCSSKMAIIDFDSYWCPWIPSFQKQHIVHFILLLKKINDNSFICIDPYYSENKKILSGYHLRKGYQNFSIISPEKKYIKVGNARDLLKPVINHIKLYMKDFIHDIKKFANDITSNKFDIDKESLSQKDVHLIPLLRQLKLIGDSRLKFSIFLEHITKENEIIYKRIIDEFRSIQKSWINIRLIFLKVFMHDQSYILSRNKLILLKLKLLSIANAEEKIFQEFSDIIK